MRMTVGELLEESKVFKKSAVITILEKEAKNYSVEDISYNDDLWVYSGLLKNLLSCHDEWYRKVKKAKVLDVKVVCDEKYYEVYVYTNYKWEEDD